MTTEVKKPEEKAQAPAQPIPPEQKKDEQKPPEEQKVGPTGLDRLTADDLKKLYAQSPGMFKEAGIVPEPKKEEEAKPPEQKPPEKPPEAPAPPTVSAAPKFGDVEIKLPTDVKVNREAVDAYLAHAKDIGLSPQQVQAEIDFQTKRAREQETKQPAKLEPPKASAPVDLAAEDAANVSKLRADPEFGKAYEANMDLARRAALKWGDKDTLAKLATSDPVLVKHFWKLALADAEDTTHGSPNRNGHESDPKEEDNDPRSESYLKRRYKNSPQMFRG